MSASLKALKMCTPSYDQSMLFQDLHVTNNKATPENVCLYKHSLILHSLFNKQKPPLDWIEINFNQNLNNTKSLLKSTSIQTIKSEKITKFLVEYHD